MKSKWFSLIALLLVVSLVLTACGATEEPTAAPEPTKEAAPTDAPEPTEEPAAADVEYDLVVLPGTFQAQLGCEADWAPDCDATALSYDEASGTWVGTFDIAAGAYEYKVAINGGWDISYPEGMNNLTLSLAEDAPVTFTFDPVTKEITAESEGLGEAPAAEAVEYEMVVVADEKNRAAKRVEGCGEGLSGSHVQVIGGFVQHQQVWSRVGDKCQGQPGLLTT